jgi:hypothetical protein
MSTDLTGDWRLLSRSSMRVLPGADTRRLENQLIPASAATEEIDYHSLYYIFELEYFSNGSKNRIR